jgi:hypothetical protein
MDHLLDDGAEVVTDLGAEGGGKGGPDGGGRRGHRTSQCRARVTTSVTASTVRMVCRAGRGEARLVAAAGRRKTMPSR